MVDLSGDVTMSDSAAKGRRPERRRSRHSGRCTGMGAVALAMIAGEVRGQTCNPIPWREADPVPSGRYAAKMVTDEARGTLLLFGGLRNDTRRQDTWEWSGADGAWRRRTPAVSPSARDSQAMAYDPGTGKVLLFGGDSGAATLGDTWEWDGSTGQWRDVTPAAGPSPRQGSAMFYCQEWDALVMFGGYRTSIVTDETWVWDRALLRWNQVQTLNPPGPRGFTSIVRDPVRSTYIMYGGYGYAYLSDTWEWNPSTTAWTKLQPVHSPPTRALHGFAADPVSNRIILFGGYGRSFCEGPTTWAWDGALADWVQLGGIANDLSAREGPAMSADPVRGVLVAFGGNTCERLFIKGTSEMLEWRSTPAGDGQWMRAAIPDMPPTSGDPTMTYDSIRGRIVMFGSHRGNLDIWPVWEWDGVQWRSYFAPGPRPGGGSLVFDGRVSILLTGKHAQPAETWGWDGQEWSLLDSNGPPFRVGYAAAYDSDRGRLMLQGGDDFNDTWEWDGTSWTPRPNSNGPAAYLHGMAYDRPRRRMLLHATIPGKTWAWDGSAWVVVSPSGPVGGTRKLMHYDAGRSRVTLLGGGSPQSWEWSGSGWVTAPVSSWMSSPNDVVAYDERNRALVMWIDYQGFTLVRGCDCYANCDGSTQVPILNVNDFVCFYSHFVSGDMYANCDGSTAPPVLTAADFMCFQEYFASGCH